MIRHSVAKRKEKRWINRRLAELRAYLKTAPRSGVIIRSSNTRTVRNQFMRYLKKKLRQLK